MINFDEERQNVDTKWSFASRSRLRRGKQANQRNWGYDKMGTLRGLSGEFFGKSTFIYGDINFKTSVGLGQQISHNTAHVY